jgi:alcohol dehydrogenase class IV
MIARSFQAPKTVFGLGAIEKVGSIANQLSVKRGLVVTDKVIEKTGLTDKIVKLLESRNLDIDIFNKVEPEPRIEIADMTAEAARSGDYDFVVGVGGGSVLDMTKIASIATTNTGSISEFVGVNKVRKQGISKILIPTTSGTGSEVTQVAIVSLEVDEIKSGIVSPELFADVALVDPIVTVTMPSKVTAATGVDAISHAIEAIMSNESSAITDTLALEAITRIWGNLRIACSQGMNVEARYNMSLGSLLAGLAFGNAGVCGGHALAYAYATKYGLTHGVSCGIALPYIMQYNLPMCEEKFALIASAIGEKNTTTSSREGARRVIVRVRELIEDVELPTSLETVGVPKQDIERLAEDVFKSDRLLAKQPRKITRKDASKLMRTIYEGNLQ